MSIEGTDESVELTPATLSIEADPPGEEESYVLITQCLQNDFFFNLNCRLVLPGDAAGKLLVHPLSEEGFTERKSRRLIDEQTIAGGPLGQLLKATVSKRLDGGGRGVLHLVNVRDWHINGDIYDRERRVYGTHCEAGSWGSEYLEGLVGLLDPFSTGRRAGDIFGESSGFDPRGTRRGTVVVHHVHSDTLFDLEGNASGSQSELNEVLRRIITPHNRETVRVAVLGVYTDIKVQIVLQSLRVGFNPDRLVVSDSLTASPTLERHLGALDFASKVLGVEVMHGVGDLARYLGSDPGEDEDLESSASEVAFADYAQYFRDKQSIVSYEDAQMRSYRRQITGRLDETVKWAKRANEFLIVCGILTLGATVILAVIASVYPGRLPVALPAALLGLSVVQLVSIFFTRPVEELTRTLSQEAVFRMLLESRSLRLALARYHLTTPQALRRDDGTGEARSRADALREQMALLMELDQADFDRFDSFGGRAGTRTGFKVGFRNGGRRHQDPHAP
jgi:nicotinamidase-related amidase